MYIHAYTLTCLSYIIFSLKLIGTKCFKKMEKNIFPEPQTLRTLNKHQTTAASPIEFLKDVPL